MMRTKLFEIADATVDLTGDLKFRLDLINERLLKALDYSKLVDFFRFSTEKFAAGEFWGKIMRAACLAYQYSHDQELKKIIYDSIDDLLSIQAEDGCISNFKSDNQPYGSDLWERKYLLVGMQEYYRITGDARVLDAMVKLMDYTISQVGYSPKVRIVDTGWAFEGIESSSILGPVVELYRITGNPKYLDFAKYIVEDEGGCKRENIFEAPLVGKDPKDVGDNGNPHESIAKAYEMMSCFEGLAGYCQATGSDHYSKCLIEFYNKVKDQEINIIGSGGAASPFNLGPGSGEQWNHTYCEQTNPNIGRGNETCVTVTWIKLCYQVLMLTGDSRVADQIERSVYNALFGAIHPAGNYFEYYPKLNGTRSMEKGFGYFIGDFNLTCCTANGPTGMAMIPKMALMGMDGGLAVNLYFPGSFSVKPEGGKEVSVHIFTDYPASGLIEITIESVEPEEFTLMLRIPEWSKSTLLKVNGADISTELGTYAMIRRKWSAADRIELRLDMRCQRIDAPHGSNRAGDRYHALMVGPVVLCRDARVGIVDNAVDIPTDANGYVNAEYVPDSQISKIHYKVPTKSGGIDVIDYASAGATWDEASKFITWMPY